MKVKLMLIKSNGLNTILNTYTKSSVKNLIIDLLLKEHFVPFIFLVPTILRMHISDIFI